MFFVDTIGSNGAVDWFCTKVNVRRQTVELLSSF